MSEGAVGRLSWSLAGIVLFVVAAMLVNILVMASRADLDAESRQKEIAANILSLQLERLATETSAASVWTDAFEKTHVQFDTEWTYANFGSYFRQLFQHDATVIVDPERRVRQTVIDGEMMEPAYGFELFKRARPQMEELAEAYSARYFRLRDGDAATQDPTTVLSRTGLVWHLNRPTLFVVQPIVPSTDRPIDVPLGRPTFVISVKFLDGALLAELGRQAMLDDLTWTENSIETKGLPLRTIDGDSLGTFLWSPERPGAEMRAGMMPVIGAFAVIMLAVTLTLIGHINRFAGRLRQSEKDARDRADHDALCGLPNRTVFADRLASELAAFDRAPSGVIGVLYLDIDRFKEINDTLGHQAGDDVIVAVTRRVATLLGPNDLFARLAGDEFAVMLARRTNEAEVLARIEAIQALVHRPIDLADQSITVTTSIGAALAPKDGTEGRELLRRADIALFRAKASGRKCWLFFDPSMEEELTRRKTIRQELAEAIRTDQLTLLYQPQMSADGKSMVGVEALVRWRHPRMGVVSPVQFIPVAEETGLIDDLGHWVMRRACLDGKRWPGLTVAVNVSPAQFARGGLVEDVLEVLRETNMDPTRLEVEITESVLMGDADDAIEMLNALRSEGIRLALDDFGTGYSSLSYLRSFPFDKLKIDKAFFQSVETDPGAAAIVHAIVGMAESLDMRVTAEGIETVGQHRFAQASGVYSLQGYLFAKPVEAAEIDRMVAAADGTAPHAAPLATAVA